jgi:hypothetical protein
VLLATVAVAALWVTMLKPKTSGGASSGGTNAYQSDVTKAHQAVAIANRASAAQGGSATTPTTPATTSLATPTHTLASTPAIAPAIPAKDPAPATTHASPVARPAVKTADAHGATRHRLDKVTAALRARKALALLFYNPAAADDVAVKDELRAVPSHGGRVVKLAVPIKDLSRYPVITTQVPVSESPTLVLIDRRRQATTLVGFAGGFEITHRVDRVLTVKQPRK